MSKARNNENQKIESIEPLILMSASAANIGALIDLTDVSIIIADDAYEAAVGTTGDDIIVGLGGDNCLQGNDGNDLFFTTKGNNNEVDGQGGTDTIRYTGDRSEFSVVALAGGGNQFPFFTNVADGEMILVNENTISVRDLDAQDPDGDTLTYMFSDGLGIPGSGFNEDTSSFNLDPNTGELSFKVAPDFEDPGDADGDNEYLVTVVVEGGKGGKGGAQDRDIVIKVQDVVNNVDKLFVVPENTTPVGPQAAASVNVFSLSGTDSALFNIDGFGNISFKNAPDFENPGDSDGNNDYQLIRTIQVLNGEDIKELITVRVTDVNENGGGNQNPFFTNVEQNEIVTVFEGNKFVGDANGQDPDGDTVTFSVVGGADGARFTIDSATGILSFVATPDFENPIDADGNNEYLVKLRIADGKGGTQDRDIVVKVLNVVEGGGNRSPFFTNVTQGEIVNVLTGTTLVGDADAQDPSGDPTTFSISGGVDASFFTINPQTGVLSFINAQDVNNPLDADGDHIYEVRLRVSDGSLFQDRDVRVCIVADGGHTGNRAPVFTNVSQGEVVWFDEKGTFVGDANAVDADGDVLTFSVVGGADASKFTINAQTGELFFINAPDFENPGDANANNLYELVIRVSDGQASVDRTIGVNVEDVDEPGGGPGGQVNQVNQINLTNIFTQLLNGLSGVHPYTGPSVY